MSQIVIVNGKVGKWAVVKNKGALLGPHFGSSFLIDVYTMHEEDMAGVDI